MGQQKVDRLMDLWAATLLKHGDAPPFANHKDMHNVIDAIPLGDVPWKCFSVKYTGEIPECKPPTWMFQNHEIYYRDPDAVIRQMLENPDFAHGFDPIPRREFDARDQQVFSDFMTGNWAWRKADKLAENPNNKGPCDCRKRQNHRLCWDWSERVLPALPLHRKHHKQCSTGSLRWFNPYRVLGYPKK